MIEKDFGSFDNFRKEFAAASNGNFGSGWTWLCQDGGKLKIVKTSNADTPVTDGLVSEHNFLPTGVEKRRGSVNGVCDLIYEYLIPSLLSFPKNLLLG